MNRRGFLKSCLAAATAPYVVTAAGVLMPVRRIITPPINPLFAGGIGRYDGIILESTPIGESSYFARLLYEECRRRSAFIRLASSGLSGG